MTPDPRDNMPSKEEKSEHLKHEWACSVARISITGPHNRAERRAYEKALRRLSREGES